MGSVNWTECEFMMKVSNSTKCLDHSIVDLMTKMRFLSVLIEISS